MAEKLEQKVKLKNFGLHIRPAATIVKLLQETRSSVTFTYKGRSVNAKSIMSLLTLVAKKNANILITVCGEDAKKTLRKLVEAFEKRFGE